MGKRRRLRFSLQWLQRTTQRCVICGGMPVKHVRVECDHEADCVCEGCIKQLHAALVSTTTSAPVKIEGRALLCRE